MHNVSQPTKEQVRQYMAQRRAERTEPPAPAEVRRRLGWNMLPQPGAAGASLRPA
ncbi:MAG: hypothetical protein V4724_39135 [Pseudomonadota bacterium]